MSRLTNQMVQKQQSGKRRNIVIGVFTLVALGGGAINYRANSQKAEAVAKQKADSIRTDSITKASVAAAKADSILKDSIAKATKPAPAKKAPAKKGKK